MLLIGILTGLIILVLLVVIHELGHGIVARRNGVVVEEFGVGFPPLAWARKVKRSVLGLGPNVKFSLNWLPLGGFVKLQGEHDAADKKGDYGAATYWQKTKILLAGVVMNWATAVLLFALLATVGIPKILPNQFSVAGDTQEIQGPLNIALVEVGSPAAKADVRIGDTILLLNGVEVNDAEELSNLTEQNKGKEVSLTLSRNNTEFRESLQLRGDNDDGKGFLGVGTAQRQELKSSWSAPIVGVGLTTQLTYETFKALGGVVADLGRGVASKFSSDSATKKSGDAALAKAGNSVSGPVGILGVIFPQFQQAGIKPLILLTAVISLSLAVMNVLPIPALDGGRWFTMTIYRLLKRPLTKEREEKIQAVGFMMLMGLVVLVTIADVSKLLG